MRVIAGNICRTILLTAILVLSVSPAAADTEQPSFADYFVDQTLRIDYFHTGDSNEEIVSLDQMWLQGIYAGSRTNLIDELNLGRYYAKVYDVTSGRLIWSRGFDSYFGEWATTNKAAAGIRRTYHESALPPMPKDKIFFTLEARQDDMSLKEVFRTEIDPAAYQIRKDPLADDVLVIKTVNNGDSHSRVDIALVGDGYTADEVDKFRTDAARFAATLLEHEPYRSEANNFNIWGVLKPSQDSGCSEPSRGVYKNTSLGSTFDSLDSPRYLLTEDNRALRDVAGHVPYDALYIMVNHERYGGGGIYNLFCTFTSDNQWSDYVFLHEFGHHFAGLADEYYTSSTAYNDFYTPGMEPNERNITRLMDPKNLKWKSAASKGIKLPTPWKKADYDSADRKYQKIRTEVNNKIARLMREGAPEDEIEKTKQEGEILSKEHQDEVDAWFAQSKYQGKVGAFEGAGYCSEGMYRSQLDCIMFSKGVKPFCAACNTGILEMIRRYGE